jgi:hypothetical protein
MGLLRVCLIWNRIQVQYLCGNEFVGLLDQKLHSFQQFSSLYGVLTDVQIISEFLKLLP